MTECQQLQQLKTDRQLIQNNINEKTKGCENEKYGQFIKKYFSSEKNTVRDLINCINSLRKNRQVFHLKEFIDMFPRDSAVESTNFKRQHVFEHICRILLARNYDNGELGNTKTFYQSLERFHPDTSVPLTINDMLSEKLNSGSSAQSVDIFFRIDKDKRPPISEWACIKPIHSIAKDSATYILIQCKYYESEKSDQSKYDIPKMFSRAKSLEKHIGNNFKIILMVNDKESLDAKFRRARNTDNNTLYTIYGVNQIDEWFQTMLRSIMESKDSFGTPVPKKYLNLRFHQEWFINTTIKDTATKKFVWGAVPRSGKSFMIGGLIAKRQKHAILILGAKSETERQFIDVFMQYSDFEGFNVVVGNTIHKKVGNVPTIYIWSQEYLKDKIKRVRAENDIEAEFKQTFKDKAELFKSATKRVDIYFDEVHKGGSTDKSRSILYSILNAGILIDIFIMSTATFVKPTIAYDKLPFDKNPPRLIEWSYEDNQYMKTISKPPSLDSIKRKDIEGINAILMKYEQIYGSTYLQVLEDYYAKNPELMIIQPSIALGNDTEHINTLLKNAFTLQCTAFDYANKTGINDVRKIFSQYDHIREILRLIAGDYNHSKLNWKLSKKTLYGHLKYKIGYNITAPHTELWYVPVSNLYISDCKDTVDANKNILKKQANNGILLDDDVITKSSIPHVEPVTRGLALALMEHPYLKEKCSVLVIHEDYALFQYAGEKELAEQSISIYSSKSKKDMVTFIKEKEIETYKANKTLIIMAAHKLRLGVSLPCADIAINFDNVRSIDANYQTMFRVLTERPQKKYGYYIDFNLERAIDFIYDYSSMYCNEPSATVEEDIFALQHVLLQFNYNGILFENNDNKLINLYNNLFEQMKVNKKGYIERHSDITKISKTIENIIISNADFTVYSKLHDIIKHMFGKEPKKLKINLKDGKKGVRVIQNSETDTEEQEDDEEDADEGTREKAIAKTVSALLPLLPPIFALFPHIDCTTFDDCLDDAISNNNTCSCDDESLNLFACYINSLVSTKQPPNVIMSILETIKIALKSDKRVHSILKLEYETIRERTLNDSRFIDKI